MREDITLSKFLRSIALCAVLALLAGTAWGQKPQIVGQERPGVVKDWEQRIALAEERLRAGDFKKAQDTSETLITEMLHRIESGPGAGPLVGHTLVVRALGAAGRNKMREALWDWHSARAMNPKLTTAELVAYGPVGEALLKAVENDRVSKKPDEDSRGASVHKVGEEERVSRPKKTKGKVPPYPRALHTACTQGAVTLETVIDQEGYVVAPAPLKSPSPILTLAALEALRTWRFKPAVYQGKPVDVYYTLTFNFSTNTCRNPAAVAEKAKEKD